MHSQTRPSAHRKRSQESEQKAQSKAEEKEMFAGLNHKLARRNSFFNKHGKDKMELYTADTGESQLQRGIHLLDAARQGDLETTLTLCRSGLNPNIVGRQHMTPLMLAADGGFSSIVEFLLDEPDILVDKEDDFQHTALAYACISGHQECAKLLLDRSAEVNTQSTFGISPLMQVCERERALDLVELLLVNGADPNVADEHGATALMAAAKVGNVATVKCLVQESARMDTKDEDGNTAMMHAAQGTHYLVVEHLAKAGADPNIKNKEGKTVYNMDTEVFQHSMDDHYAAIAAAVRRGRLNIDRRSSTTSMLTHKKDVDLTKAGAKAPPPMVRRKSLAEASYRPLGMMLNQKHRKKGVDVLLQQ